MRGFLADRVAAVLDTWKGRVNVYTRSFWIPIASYTLAFSAIRKRSCFEIRSVPVPKK